MVNQTGGASPHNKREKKMKLTMKEIKYIRQSLEYRAEYYAIQPEHYKKFFEEIKPIIKKFKSLEGESYVDFKKINKQIGGKI
jgi:ribosomal protein L19E